MASSTPQARNFESQELGAARAAMESLVDEAALEAAVAAALAEAGAALIPGTFGVTLAASPCGEGQVIAAHLTWEHRGDQWPQKNATANVFFLPDEITGGSLEKLYHQRVECLMRDITGGYKRAA